MIGQKIAIGTVQFGLDYGISNSKGKVGIKAVESILDAAYDLGINTLDTAINYGSSEEVLGIAGVGNWNVVSKLPAIPSDCKYIEGWILNQVLRSLEKLKIGSLYALLLHEPRQALGKYGKLLIETLEKLKSDGLIKNIGVSIYDPSELDDLYGICPIDLLQLPLNILDRRAEQSDLIKRLSGQGCEIHVRSVFLQGLLLMKNEARPRAFDKWSFIWDQLDDWLLLNKLTRLEACLSAALSWPLVNKVILGVTSLSELQEISNATVNLNLNLKLPDTLSSSDLNLITPSLWK